MRSDGCGRERQQGAKVRVSRTPAELSADYLHLEVAGYILPALWVGHSSHTGKGMGGGDSDK